MDQFVKVASKNEIIPKRPKVVKLEEIEIVLFRVDEEIFAIENLCPHQQFAVFHHSIPEGTIITCPMHSWSFDLRSGKAVTGGGRLNTFEVRIEGNDVLVKKPDFKERFSQF